jgi:hypothetical protein
MEDKKKRAPSAWAKALAEHMKAGGKFPKKGTEDYEKVKKLSESMKDTKAPEVAAVAEKSKAKRGPYKKKDTVEPVPEKAEVKVESVEVPKAKRGPYKKKAAVEAKKEEVAEVVVEQPLKAKRDPYKKKAVAEKDDVETIAKLETHSEPVKKTDSATMEHNLFISQTIPLARLQSMMSGKTIPFMNFEAHKM